MPHRITESPMIHIDLLKVAGGLAVSFIGGTTTYLAQFGPKEAEGWIQLGGVGIALGGAVVAIRYLVKSNEKKDGVIMGLIASHDEKREKDRERFEQQWSAIRKEDIEQREADREIREKFSDSVNKLADAVKSIPKN
jgi:hypothetical protein